MSESGPPDRGQRNTGSPALRRLNTILRQLSPDAPTGRPQPQATTASTTPAPKTPVTGHWAGGKALLPQPDSSPTESAYLMRTNMNISHDSREHMQERAQAFAKWAPTEMAMVMGTKMALQDSRSDVFQQSSHMLHTQRGAIAARLHDKQALDTSTIKPQGKGDEYNEMVRMMVTGTQGPMTFAQSQMGVEAAAVGHQYLRDKRDTESGGAYESSRVGAERGKDSVTGKDSHSTRTRTGVDLSPDPGTRERDAQGLPVFMGTSGSSSDVVRSHSAALGTTSTKLGDTSSFAAPGLSPERAATAVKDLSLNWMRGSAMTGALAKGIDKQLNKHGQQRVSQGSPLTTQTHTYPEIASAVDLTLNPSMSMKASTTKAHMRMDSVRQALHRPSSGASTNGKAKL